MSGRLTGRRIVGPLAIAATIAAGAAVAPGATLAAGSSTATAASSGTSAGAGASAGTSATTASGGLVAVGPAAPPPPSSSDLGRATASTPLSLSIVLKPRDPAALASFTAAVSTPGSPLYRHYLLKGQFAGRFGPTASTVAAVKKALRAQGLTPGSVTPDNLIIHASATVATAQTAFHTPIHAYRGRSGKLTLANTAAPLLPSAVAAEISSVVGLDNAPAAAPAGPIQATPQPGHQTASPALSPAVAPGAPNPCQAAITTRTEYQGVNAFTADQLGQAYDLNPYYAAGDQGAGQTIGFFVDTYGTSDISTYKSCYGVNTNVTNVPVDGGSSDADAESTLDIEDVIGLAPQANVLVYQGPNSVQGLIDTYDKIATADQANVVSTSWGLCEKYAQSEDSSAESTAFAEMVSQGQSIYAASGDEGSADCAGSDGTTGLAADDPASQPNVTGVGGTSLTAIGNPPATAPTEKVWNNGSGEASGGGISISWPMPTYQSGSGETGVFNSYSTGSPCGAATGTDCREEPDVSADADPDTGYVVYYSDGSCGSTCWTVYGGTSGAAPTWAAFTALTNASSACTKPVGFINPTAYKLAAAGTHDFNDVLPPGSNAYDGNANHPYPVTTGYDMATGLGTPVGATLGRDLCAGGVTPPAITSPAGATFPPNVADSFTVTTTGSPINTITETGTLPSGLTFVDNHNNTATISGTPTGTSTTTLTVTANNGVPPAATQNFVLTVGNSPPLVTVSAPSPPAGQQGYFNGSQLPVDVSVSAASAAGIKSISCTDSVNSATPIAVTVTGLTSNGSTETGTIPLSTPDGTHAIVCTATDNANNSGAASGSHNTATVKIFSTPPGVTVSAPSPPNGQNGYFNGSQVPVTVNVSATSTVGVASLACNDNGSALTVANQTSTSTTLSGTVSVSTSASHAITCTAVDGVGNSGAAAGSANSATVNIIATPAPVTVSAPIPPAGQNGYFNGTQLPVGVSVSATGPSGVSALACTDNGTTVNVTGQSSTGNTRTGAVSLSSDGTHAIACTATDGAGNTGAAAGSQNTATIKILSTPAAVTVTAPSPPSGQQGYFNGSQLPVSVAVSATSPVGVTALTCTDGGAPVTVGGQSSSGNTRSGTISLSSNGTHAILCGATDGAGNIGAAAGSQDTAALQILSTPPAVTVTAPTPPSGQDGFFNGSQKPVTIGVSATSPVGAVALICTDNNQAVTVSNQTTNGNTITGSVSESSDGTHAIACTARDAIGNAGAASGSHAAGTVSILSTPPNVTLSAPSPPTGQDGYFNRSQVPVVLQVSATSTAGVTALSCTDGGSPVTVSGQSSSGSTRTGRVSLSSDGSHAIACDATDGAGNTGASPGSQTTATVSILGTPPQVTVSAPAPPSGQDGFFNGGDLPVVVNVSATSPAGVNTLACTDGGAPVTVGSQSSNGNTLSGSISLSTPDGTHAIACTAGDGAGNSGAATGSQNTASVKILAAVPQVTVSAPSPPAGQDGYFNHSQLPVTVHVSATSPAGVSSLACADNGSSVAVNGQSSSGNSRAGSLTLSADGTHGVVCGATDGAGNTGAAAGSQMTATVSILGTPPQVTVTAPTPPTGQNGFFNGNGTQLPVSIPVSATSPAGVTALSCTDNGAPITVSGQTSTQTGRTGSISVSSNGAHAILCSATDGAGNAGAATGSIDTGTVKVQSTPPQITVSAGSPPAGQGGLWNASQVPVPVSVSASSPAGVSSLACTDNGTTVTVSGQTTTATTLGGSISLTSDGTHSIVCAATDDAGNTGASGTQTSATVKILATMPQVTVSAPSPPAGQGGAFSQSQLPVDVGVSATSPAGIIALSCTDDGIAIPVGSQTSTSSSRSGSIALSAGGTNAIDCVATDGAGNTGAATGSSDSATITITGTAPTPGGSPGGTPSTSSVPPGGNSTPLVSSGVGTAQVGTVRQKSGKVTAALRCTGAAGLFCTVSGRLVVIETMRHGKVIAVGATFSASRKKRATQRSVAIGAATLTLSTGKSATLTIAPNATGLRLLARYRRLPSTLTLDQLSATLASVISKPVVLTTRGVTLIAAPARKRG